MMAETLEGLFGPTADQIRASQADEMRKQALSFANLTPMERANMQMFQAGAGLVDTFAPAFGLKNQSVARAERTQDILGQGKFDLNKSEGLFAKANQFREAGDVVTGLKLAAMAAELKKQEDSVLLAQQKQDELESFRRDQFEERNKLEKQRLEQQAEAAKIRSEDMRYSIDQRREAAREAAATRAAISQMAASVRQSAQEKPLTADQRLKWERKKGEDIGTLQAVEYELNNMIAQATDLKKHPGLPGATGASGYIYSAPGGNAANAEALLDEFKASVSSAGLEKVRMGGGIGAMTVQEWPLVEKMIANIDPVKLGLKGTQAAIDKVIVKMQAMASVAKKRYQAIHGESAPGEMDGHASQEAPDDFNAKWAKLKSGEKLVGPDGKTYTKK